MAKTGATVLRSRAPELVAASLLAAAWFAFHVWRPANFVLTVLPADRASGPHAAGADLQPLSPLYAFFLPAVTPWLAGAIVAIAAGVWIARTIGRRRTGLFLLVAVVWATALNLAVHGARSGTLPAKELAFYMNEEILSDALAIGSSPITLLGTYCERQPALSIHGRTKPPGFALLYQALLAVFPKRLSTLGLVITALGSLLVIPTYALSRGLDDEMPARGSALLAASAPASVLFGAASLDAVFAVVAAGCFALTAREIAARALWKRIALGVGLFVALMLSYSAFVVGLVCALWLVLDRWAEPRRLFRSLAEIGVSVVALFLLLKWTAGFDAWTCFVNARRLNSELMTGVIGKPLGTAAVWSYASIGNALAFLIGLGPAIVAAIGSVRPQSWSRSGRMLGIATGAAFLVACFGGLYLLETERILLFFVPLAAVLAGRSPRLRLAETIALSCTTALVLELLCFTIW